MRYGNHYYQVCPKCRHEGTFDVRYLAPYATIMSPDAGDSIGYLLGRTKMFTGPCLVLTCRLCTYSYKQPAADGEGEENAPEKDYSNRSR